MSGSFYYGLKARFYGVLFQLPWSFFVTVCVLMPVAYVVDQPARILLIELTVYWTLLIALVWLFKDIHTQRYLLEFSVDDQHLCVYKKRTLITMYALSQIKMIREFSKNSIFSNAALNGGFVVTFNDGSEVPVFNQISDYRKLNKILSSSVIVA